MCDMCGEYTLTLLNEVGFMLCDINEHVKEGDHILFGSEEHNFLKRAVVVRKASEEEISKFRNASDIWKIPFYEANNYHIIVFD